MRVGAVVAAVAAAAAAIAVVVAVLQSREPAGASAPPARPRGAPPLLLDLALGRDREAVALRRASSLYQRGRRVDAARAFGRYRSLNARVGRALARWPDGTLFALERLAAEHPRSALVRLNLGLALFWAGRRAEAVAAWRDARRVEPDSLSAVRAGDLLHPNSPPGLPSFVPSFDPPSAIRRLPRERQLTALARGARHGGHRAKLLYGVALQRLGRPRSAEREFAAALRAAPGNLEAKVAVAVARFDKANPRRAFSRLGPLAARYGRAPTVRFHLGLLLLWLGELEDAERQLELARRYGPATRLGREAKRFLDRLESIRTG